MPKPPMVGDIRDDCRRSLTNQLGLYRDQAPGHGRSRPCIGRRFSNDNRLAIGLRAWGIDYSEKEGIQNKFTTLDASVYGLIIGYEFNK